MQGFWKDTKHHFKKDKAKHVLKRAYRNQLKKNQSIYIGNDSEYKEIYSSKKTISKKDVLKGTFYEVKSIDFDFNKCDNCPLKPNCSYFISSWDKKCEITHNYPGTYEIRETRTVYQKNGIWIDFYTNEEIRLKSDNLKKTGQVVFVEEDEKFISYELESASDIDMIYNEKVGTYFYKKYDNFYAVRRKKYARTKANRTGRRKIKDWLNKIKQDIDALDTYQNPKNYRSEKSIKWDIH